MTTADFHALKTDLKLDEGIRFKPYRCTAGKLTIGCGRNIEDKGISMATVEQMLQEDLDECYEDLLSFHWFAGLDGVRQQALMNLRFQLGPTRFRSFKKMLDAVLHKDWDAAAYELFNSKWWGQTQPSRRERVQEMLKRGRG